MALIDIRQLTFSYPAAAAPTLHGVDLQVEAGEFLALCGVSGSGKSTLLRHLKPALTPHGEKLGEIFFDGQPLGEISERQQSQEIGFVFQSPDDQIVTDKVWHELSFGMESLGYSSDHIRRRVAEMASFFGIEHWFEKSVEELSGGQKQLLNLAAVMVLQPKVLVLDEPTSQLDPIAATEFFSVLGRIHRELGTTVIVTEQRLEELLPIADRVAVMEGGRIVAHGDCNAVGRQLKACDHRMFRAMPSAMRLWGAVESDAPCPITVGEGRAFVTEYGKDHPLQPLPPAEIPAAGDVVVEVKNGYFRYEKNAPDVVKGLNMTVRRGELYALMGGNGAGKSTTLRLLSGIRKPYRGTVTCHGRVAALPQDPRALFVKTTVWEELREVSADEAAIGDVLALCGLSHLVERHPFDLSGGEQQRLGLCKLLLLQPDILLLDEPSKGLDAAFKDTFAAILRALTEKGVTIIMVSHDVDFCASVSHRCALFFGGSIAAEGTPRDFFSGNSFYTTAANRMARHMVADAVTVEEVAAVLGGHVPPPPPPPSFGGRVTPPKEVAKKTEKLPLWRKLFGTFCALAAINLGVWVGVSNDFSVMMQGTTITAEGIAMLWRYVLLLVLAFGCAACFTRRGERPPSRGWQKLSRRSIVGLVVTVVMIPVTAYFGGILLPRSQHGLVSALVLIECMLPFFLVFEGRRPKARELVLLAALCALGVAGRAAFFMLPQCKPVTALTIIAGAAFGGETGFLVGAVSMLVSNMLFGQGPWTPWQMFAMGLIGFVAALLFHSGLLRRTRWTMALFGFVAVLALYGGIMNPASAIMLYGTQVTGKILLTYYLTGLPMDCVHAATTALFLFVAAEPLLDTFQRIRGKYGLVELHGKLNAKNSLV